MRQRERPTPRREPAPDASSRSREHHNEPPMIRPAKAQLHRQNAIILAALPIDQGPRPRRSRASYQPTRYQRPQPNQITPPTPCSRGSTEPGAQRPPQAKARAPTPPAQARDPTEPTDPTDPTRKMTPKKHSSALRTQKMAPESTPAKEAQPIPTEPPHARATAERPVLSQRQAAEEEGPRESMIIGLCPPRKSSASSPPTRRTALATPLARPRTL